MSLLQEPLVSLSSPHLMKMEERKRPAAQDEDGSGPPLKRQITTTNGNGAKYVADADVPWQEDLEVRISFSAMKQHLLPAPETDVTNMLILCRLSKKTQFFGKCRNIREKETH